MDGMASSPLRWMDTLPRRNPSSYSSVSPAQLSHLPSPICVTNLAPSL